MYDGFDTHWDASFTQDTPERLVAQFFTHLATTTPVERTFRDVPYLVQNLDDALITPRAPSRREPTRPPRRRPARPRRTPPLTPASPKPVIPS
ncbi:hypothetical protein GCM10020256_11360 [Streptomyces thermocoprophilus]